MPNLTNLLQYQDTTLVEHACQCLSRIADATKHSAQNTVALCTPDLLQQARLASEPPRVLPLNPKL